MRGSKKVGYEGLPAQRWKYCRTVNNIVLVAGRSYYSSLRHCRWAVCWVGVLTKVTRLEDSDCNIAVPETAMTQLYMACLKMLLPLENAKTRMLADEALLGVRLKTSLRTMRTHGAKCDAIEVFSTLAGLMMLLAVEVRRDQSIPLLVIAQVAWITNRTVLLALCSRMEVGVGVVGLFEASFSCDNRNRRGLVWRLISGTKYADNGVSSAAVPRVSIN